VNRTWYLLSVIGGSIVALIVLMALVNLGVRA